jgi:mxaJ protein
MRSLDRFSLFIIAAGLLSSSPTFAATDSSKVFRVCGDPDNLPFSNTKLQGFDNKIAAVIAADLGMKIDYFWYPAQRGLMRNTIDKNACDVVFGIPKGYDALLGTKPYYRSTYVLAYRRDRKYHVTSLDAPELRKLKVGANSGTPAEEALARRDILDNVASYSLFYTEGHAEHPSQLVADVVSGKVDIATPWGPFAGYFVKKLHAPLELVPLKDEPNLQLSFDVVIGVKKGNQALKTAIEGALDRRQKEIHAILEDFGVPQVPMRTSMSGATSTNSNGLTDSRPTNRVASGGFIRVASNVPATTAQPASAPAKAPAPGPATTKVVATTPGGTKNPYTGKPDAIKAGKDLFIQNACAGCHGAGGGGGMGPSLIDDKWQFGSTDEILFKQITGQTKGTMPKVYATMPRDNVWKILAFVRSLYKGDPKKKNW